MEHGDAGTAIRALEIELQRRPGDVALHERLGRAHHRILALDTREAELDAICRELPFAFTSLLHLSALREARGDRRAAAIGFLRAIKTAQNLGFWQDEGSTPPWLRSIVLHAMDVAEAGRLEIFHETLEPMIARYGKDELARVTQSLEMYLGLVPTVYADPRQRPTFLYVPGLPVAPIFPRDALPFADWYEAQTDAIAAELRAVRDGEGVQPFHYKVPEQERGQLVAGGTWDAFFFFINGERIAANHAACPRVSDVLSLLPLDHVRDHGPEVCFSIMRPGAHILPHRGVTNSRSVLHLGLEVPDDCGLHLIGIEEISWQVGECFAFDDTYEHEAWNRSAATRAILLADIWNPYLREAERCALAELVAVIGDVNRQTASPRPRARAPGP